MEQKRSTNKISINQWQIAFSQACNLRCRYCITGYGKLFEQDKYMSLKTQELVITEIFKNIDLSASLNIKFVVGETFLYFEQFIEFYRKIKIKAESINVPLSVCVGSNGVLLNKEKMDLLADEGIGIIFSIDGPKAVHNANRINLQGQGSYDKAYENWKYYRKLSLNHPKQPLCNIQTVISDGKSFLDIASFWAEHPRVVFDCVLEFPSLFTENGTLKDYELRKKDFLQQFKEFSFHKAKELSVPLFLSEYSGPSQLLKYWTNLFMENSCSSCKCANGIIAIDVDGKYYPCDGFIGFKKWQVGDVFSGIYHHKILQINETISEIRFQCKDCNIRHLCEGGCLAAEPSENLVLDREGSCDFYKQIAEIVSESYKIMNSEA